MGCCVAQQKKPDNKKAKNIRRSNKSDKSQSREEEDEDHIPEEEPGSVASNIHVPEYDNYYKQAKPAIRESEAAIRDVQFTEAGSEAVGSILTNLAKGDVDEVEDVMVDSK